MPDKAEVRFEDIKKFVNRATADTVFLTNGRSVGRFVSEENVHLTDPFEALNVIPNEMTTPIPAERGTGFVVLGWSEIARQAANRESLDLDLVTVEQAGVFDVRTSDPTMSQRIDNVEVLVVTRDEIRLDRELVIEQITELERHVRVGDFVNPLEDSAPFRSVRMGVSKD